MRIGVIGINHKLADLKLREKLAKACQRRFGADYSVPNTHHFLLLSTCNRTEVYFSSEDLAATHSYLLGILRHDVEEDFEQKLYSYFGIDCFCHLARVTVGLDSAVIAETEIQGQVKNAYELASQYRQLPKELHFLFQKSLSIAKRVRSELNLGRGMPNLEHAIFKTGKHFFKNLNHVHILFIGASEINQKILHYFKTKKLSHITLCNRTDEQAQEIAQAQSIQTLDWVKLSEWSLYDWIICGTKSPDYLIKQKDLPANRFLPKLVMDLSVPRNVDPGLDEYLTLLNIDQINRLLNIRNRYMEKSLMQAEDLIFEISHLHVSRYVQREQASISTLFVTA